MQGENRLSLRPWLVAAVLVALAATRVQAAEIDYVFTGENFGPFGSAGEPSLPSLEISGSLSVDVDESAGTINAVTAFELSFFGASFGLADIGFDSTPAVSNPNAGIFAPPRAEIGALVNGFADPLPDPGGDFLLTFDHIADPDSVALTGFFTVWPEDTPRPPFAGAFFTSTLYGPSSLSISEGLPVPEPGGLLLLGPLGLALGLRRSAAAS